MSMYHDRKITVRLQQEEYEEALRLAARRNWRTWKKPTISDLIRVLLTEAIQMNRLKEAEKNDKQVAVAEGGKK